MSFLSILNEKKKIKSHTERGARESRINLFEQKLSEASSEEAERLLRIGNKKIKLITPTSFGTQIDFAKAYDENEIKEILKDFTIKLKKNSVFIVD